MALAQQLKKIREAQEKARTATATVKRKDIARAIGSLLPPATMIAWSQGTPSFNDGDPCVFRVHEPHLAHAFVHEWREAQDAVPPTPARPAVAAYSPAVYGVREVETSTGHGSAPSEYAQIRQMIAPQVGECPPGHDPSVPIEARPAVERVRGRPAVEEGMYQTKTRRDFGEVAAGEACDSDNESLACAPLTYATISDLRDIFVDLNAAKLAELRRLWRDVERSNVLRDAFGDGVTVAIYAGGRCVVEPGGDW